MKRLTHRQWLAVRAHVREKLGASGWLWWADPIKGGFSVKMIVHMPVLNRWLAARASRVHSFVSQHGANRGYKETRYHFVIRGLER